MMGSTSTLLIAPAIYKNAGYHTGSFAPVARVADSSEVLAVHPSVPAKSVAELIALAKSKPGVLNYGSAGIGTLPHIEGELLKALAQIEINHVPYRGGGPALTGLLAGQIEVLFSTLTQMLPHIQDGRLRALAISSATRSKLALELPTLVESGFGQFVTTSVSAVVAPPNTPIEIRRQLVQSRGRRARFRRGPAGLIENGRRGAAIVAGGTRLLLGGRTTKLGSHHHGHADLG